jgi:hypothetical protein
LLANVVEESERFIFAICGPLAIARWKKPPRAEDLQRFAELKRRIQKQHIRVCVLFILTGDEHGELDRGVTEATDLIVSQFGDSVFAQAFVLVGSGFNSAALRDWIGHYQDPDKGGWPTRSFASLEGACGWLARRPDQAPDLRGPRRLFQAVAPSMGLGMPEA